jgi:hypothetical protein
MRRRHCTQPVHLPSRRRKTRRSYRIDVLEHLLLTPIVLLRHPNSHLRTRNAEHAHHGQTPVDSMTSPVLAGYNEPREQGRLPLEGGASQV